MIDLSFGSDLDLSLIFLGFSIGILKKFSGEISLLVLLIRLAIWFRNHVHKRKLLNECEAPGEG